MKSQFAQVLLMVGLTPMVALARPDVHYDQVVRDTAQMVRNQGAQSLASSHGLRILNLTWEDSGRYKGSSVGPNISDLTLQVQQGKNVTCMPVIRFPNFEDKSADLKMDDFMILVGNEQGRALRRVSLRQYLGNLREYLHDSKSWKGSKNSLLAERDGHVLVSAQACFLPIPKKGQAKFNPVLFNYQSYKGNPAVLTLVCTREGTSATVIDNTRDGFSQRGSWGQRLFFNDNGERASFTGQRMSDFQAGDRGPSGGPEVGAMQGMNMVLLVQVPLKHKPPSRRACLEAMPAPCATVARTVGGPGDVENAVVGHGEVEGPFTEIDNLAIERDPRFPVRVTVQFYKATSNGVVTGKDLAGIASQINRVYADGDYVGSLVTGGDTERPTEYDGNKREPKTWWNDFWNQYESKSKPQSSNLFHYMASWDWLSASSARPIQ